MKKAKLFTNNNENANHYRNYVKKGQNDAIQPILADYKKFLEFSTIDFDKKKAAKA